MTTTKPAAAKPGPPSEAMEWFERHLEICRLGPLTAIKTRDAIRALESRAEKAEKMLREAVEDMSGWPEPHPVWLERARAALREK